MEGVPGQPELTLQGVTSADVTIACATWGSQWGGHRLRFHIDASSVTGTLTKMSTSSQHLREEARSIAMLAALNGFSAEVEWVAGELNIIAVHSVVRQESFK